MNIYLDLAVRELKSYFSTAFILLIIIFPIIVGVYVNHISYFAMIGAVCGFYTYYALRGDFYGLEQYTKEGGFDVK